MGKTVYKWQGRGVIRVGGDLIRAGEEVPVEKLDPRRLEELINLEKLVESVPDRKGGKKPESVEDLMGAKT